MLVFIFSRKEEKKVDKEGKMIYNIIIKVKENRRNTLCQN